MSLFHHHQWKEVGRTFTPPLTQVAKLSNASIELVERAMHGFTVIELHCEGCGDIGFSTTIGRSERSS